ncbi:MAG: hypothetical protein OEY79_04635 [Anaplasmataceae bacterium]|nr:hypothetical protein [Anaplasmataceae bacterium]
MIVPDQGMCEFIHLDYWDEQYYRLHATEIQDCLFRPYTTMDPGEEDRPVPFINRISSDITYHVRYAEDIINDALINDEGAIVYIDFKEIKTDQGNDFLLDTDTGIAHPIKNNENTGQKNETHNSIVENLDVKIPKVDIGSGNLANNKVDIAPTYNNNNNNNNIHNPCRDDQKTCIGYDNKDRPNEIICKKHDESC